MSYKKDLENAKNYLGKNRRLWIKIKYARKF